jgi:hypothetical protein
VGGGVSADRCRGIFPLEHFTVGRREHKFGLLLINVFSDGDTLSHYLKKQVNGAFFSIFYFTGHVNNELSCALFQKIMLFKK